MINEYTKSSKSVTDLGEPRFFTHCKHLSPWQSSATSFPQVVTCFLQRDDKVLVLQRGRKDEQYKLWGIPGGKINRSETLQEGLCREVYEETGVILSSSDFTHLGSALSKTMTDGQYGLHLYHAKFPMNIELPVINEEEHLAYQWVTLEEFIGLNLLHAQKEAFLFVCSQLSKKMKNPKLPRLYA